MKRGGKKTDERKGRKKKGMKSRGLVKETNLEMKVRVRLRGGEGKR